MPHEDKDRKINAGVLSVSCEGEHSVRDSGEGSVNVSALAQTNHS